MLRPRSAFVLLLLASCSKSPARVPAPPAEERPLPPITIVDAPPPVRVAPREAEPPKVDPVVARLTADSDTLAEDAKDILRNHPPEVRAAAALRLAGLVREIDSDAWAIEARKMIAEANVQAGVSPTEAELEGQLTAWRDRRVGLVFDAMAELGGSELAAVLLDEAERASASLPRRRGAFLAAEVASPGDASRRERQKALAAALVSLAAKEPPTQNGKEEAASVARRLTPGFRRCYDRARAAQPDLDVSFELELQVDARGAVTGSKAGATPAKGLARCVEELGRAILFPPIAGGKTAVVIPIAFTPNRVRSL